MTHSISCISSLSMLGKAKRVVVSFGLGERGFLVTNGSDWEGEHDQQAEDAATVSPLIDEKVLYSETVELLEGFEVSSMFHAHFLL